MSTHHGGDQNHPRTSTEPSSHPNQPGRAARHLAARRRTKPSPGFPTLMVGIAASALIAACWIPGWMCGPRTAQNVVSSGPGFGLGSRAQVD